MGNVKLTIAYYSSTGANYKMSKWAEESAIAQGAEVRRRKFRETAPSEAIEANEAWKRFVESSRDEKEMTLDDLEWADALLFHLPTRYGNMASQVQQFIDTTGGLWFGGKLAGKVVSATSSAQNTHGGQETTLLSFYKTMMHWGTILVPPGYNFKESFQAGGNPYGTSFTVGGDGSIREDEGSIKAAVSKQVEQLLNVSQRIVD